MDEEDEDDIYATSNIIVQPNHGGSGNGSTSNAPAKKEGAGSKENEEEEGEEVEEDESDSDIDIITERKGDQAVESVPPARASSTIKVAPPKPVLIDQGPVRRFSPAVKAEATGKETPTRLGSSYPAVKTSSLDLDAKPVYESNGKPITDIDMDADFPEDDKPWRRPGTDMTDYFNYGFDEFTWASYCLKQKNMRKEITDSKKQMEEMQNFLTMPGGMPSMPGMPGQSGGAASGMPAMGGPADLPPEMQQMMQQMMAQGMDPTQMDPAAFMQMMQGAAGGAGDPAQNFGGQGYGQQNQNQQQMGYGFGNGGGGGGGQGGGNRNQGGRGRRW